MVAAVNRLGVYPEPPLPRDPQARRDHLSDAVMKAVSAAARLLDDGDSAVVLKAVKEILDLEKTRMRHGHNVLGDLYDRHGRHPELSGEDVHAE